MIAALSVGLPAASPLTLSSLFEVEAMKRTTLALAFVSLATLFAACGGGGGSSQGSSARPLLVDTASGGGVFLSGSLQGLVLETGDGLKVPLVLEPPVTLVVADPAGETSGVDLAAVPMHPWTSVHLQFVPGSLVARDNDGKDRPVEVASSMVEVPIQPSRFGGHSWLMLRHTGSLDLVTEGTRLRWRPAMTGSWVDGQVVTDVRMRVERVDVGARLAWGQLASCGRMGAELHFPDSAVLMLDSTGETVPPETFLTALKPGSELLFDGIASGTGRVEVSAAMLLDEEDDDDKKHRGRRFEVEGQILAIQEQSTTFTLGVTRLRRGNWSRPLPESLTVQAGDAKIKYRPRRGRHTGHLPFSSLQVGMLVEVEGFGAPVEGAVTAKKVDIRSSEVVGRLGELLGEVTEVKLSDPAQMVIEPVGNDQFRIGGKTYSDAVVLIGQETVLVRHEGDKLVLIELGAVVIGERCVVLGRVVEANRLRAALVRVLPK
jgi:hypothetical protein